MESERDWRLCGDCDFKRTHRARKSTGHYTRELDFERKSVRSGKFALRFCIFLSNVKRIVQSRAGNRYNFAVRSRCGGGERGELLHLCTRSVRVCFSRRATRRSNPDPELAERRSDRRVSFSALLVERGDNDEDSDLKLNSRRGGKITRARIKLKHRDGDGIIEEPYVPS